MLRAVDLVRKVAPGARSQYLAALEQDDAALRAAGLYDNKLRLAHWLAQHAHESGGFTIVRESMKYRAPRIMEIFGVGRHSAKVTSAEAKQLAGNEYALAERVYGLGNPNKARELGNTAAGDGFKYRGNGLNQMTGKAAHRRASDKLGFDFVANPEAVTKPEWAVKAALVEWKDGGFNALADRNDIDGVTKRLNGGYNGLKDRKEWFAKFWALLERDSAAWQSAERDPQVAYVQDQLRQLGYAVEVDGRKGPETEAAIRAFQKQAGIKVDGAVGEVTRAALKQALERTKAPPPEAPKPIEPPPPVETAKGGGLLAAILALLQEWLGKIEGLAGIVPYAQYALGALLVVIVALILWGVVRSLRKGENVLAGLAVALIAGSVLAVAWGPALAHQAASGWDYPLECCSGKDCYRIDASAVQLRTDGAYVIRATGEVFLPPDAAGAPGAKHFKWAPDGDFHRCSPDGKMSDGYSYCLFVPQPGA